MTDYLIDFETRSSLDIAVGAERYLRTSQSDIVCMSWMKTFEGNRRTPVKLWVPGQDLPFIVGPKDRVYAFNIQFDQRVWNILGPKYGFSYLPIEQCVDVMAIAGRYGLPQKLETLGKVLRLRLQKNPDGKRLMKKICSPPFAYTAEELRRFFKYCMDDTEVMYQALKALPSDSLSESEQRVWLETVELNRRGLNVDVASAAAIAVRCNEAMNKANMDLDKFTDGALTAYTQVKRIPIYCRDYGVDLPDCKAETVEAFVKAGGLPPEVEYVLKNRMLYGSTSVAKYTRIVEQAYQGIIFDNLRYYGAHTGRWSGLSFQIHNMPRGQKGKDYTAIIQALIQRMIEDVLNTSRDMIRPMIIAPKGKKLCIVDYKSIENVLLAWFAGEEWVLDLYRTGKDEYKMMAVKLYNVTYDAVLDFQRAMCKPIILGAGYGLAGPGLVAYAEGYGISMTQEEGAIAISVYRETHPNVVAFWYESRNSFMSAIKYPGNTYYSGNGKVSFKVVRDRNTRKWLKMTLPSGRAMFYYDPKIIDGRFGEAISSMRLDSQTQQWVRKEISPGKTVENIIQAAAGDILRAGIHNLITAGVDLRAHTHDETISVVPGDFPSWEPIADLMCKLEPWCPDLPLSAEGKIVNRYQKI